MKKLNAVVAVALVAVASVASAGAASAAETSQEETVFSEYVDALEVSDGVVGQLEAKFDAMSAAQQEALAAQLELDPSSVITFSAPVTTVTSVPAALKTTALSTRATSYVAKNSISGYFLGIPVATFTNEFKYNASSTKVTSILSCKGWYSGFGLSGSTSPSSYISSTGRGTCDVVHHLSLVFKGSPVSFNKQHIITTNSGNPKSYKATIRTV